MGEKKAVADVLAVAGGACRGIRVAHGVVLTVRAGHAWVTVERDAADYWLAPGDALPLAPGERAWIGGWDGAVCCELAALAQPEPRERALAALCARMKRRLGLPRRAWP